MVDAVKGHQKRGEEQRSYNQSLRAAYLLPIETQQGRFSLIVAHRLAEPFS